MGGHKARCLAGDEAGAKKNIFCSIEMDSLRMRMLNGCRSTAAPSTASGQFYVYSARSSIGLLRNRQVPKASALYHECPRE